MINRIRDKMRGWGATSVSLFALGCSIALLFVVASIYFGAPAAQEAIYDDDLSQAVKEELEEDLDSGGLEPGPSQGAIANGSYGRPVAFFEEQGTRFEWQPSPNWAGRGSHPIEVITVHVTAGGTCDGIVNFFKQPGGVASHFLVCPTKVVQQVEMGDAAFHQGRWGARINPFGNPIIDFWWRNGINPNLRTIGIETLLKPGEQIDNFPSMQENLIDLLVYLSITLNLAPDRVHIIGHFETDMVNRPSDPVCCMSLDNIVAEVARRRFSPPTPPPHIPHPDLVMFEDGWAYRLSDGYWINPHGWPEWSPCNIFGERWNEHHQDVFLPGSSFYSEERGFWSSAGAC